MHLITVFLPNDTTLTYKVETYKKENGKVIFINPKNGMEKDFPDSMCAIEEVEG